MQYIYGTTKIQQEKDSVVVLGNFDGVHVAHQKLFELAKQRAMAKQLQVVIFSFFPHPTWVIGNHPKPLLMSREDKKAKIASIGADILIEYPFTKKFASVAPKDFFTEILMKQLKAKELVIGENYCFGKGKQGDQYYMKKLGEEFGIQVNVVETLRLEDRTISSSTIRQLIEQGDIPLANELLGEPYSYSGIVVEGKKLGRRLGFPTINLVADSDRIYPPNGVYATKVHVYNATYLGITNIGYNPTVNGKVKMIETYVFDFDEDLYGQKVRIDFYSHIRKEQKFGSVDMLKAQIQKDKKQVQLFHLEQGKSLQIE